MSDIDLEIARVQAELPLARARAAAELARGRPRIVATRHIWPLLERKAALQMARMFPQAQVFHDARVVGLETPDGSYLDLRIRSRRGGLELPRRQWDVLLVEWEGTGRATVANAQPVELKSAAPEWPGTLGRSQDQSPAGSPTTPWWRRSGRPRTSPRN